MIVQLLDWQDYPYHIMVLERPSLCEDVLSLLKRNGGISREDIAQHIMGQVTEVAEICCKGGVFHRNIKLEKLLITLNILEVKMIDLGCGNLLMAWDALMAWGALMTWEL